MGDVLQIGRIVDLVAARFTDEGLCTLKRRLSMVLKGHINTIGSKDIRHGIAHRTSAGNADSFDLHNQGSFQDHLLGLS